MASIRVPRNHLPLFESLASCSDEDIVAIRRRLDSWTESMASEEAIGRILIGAGVESRVAEQLADLFDSLVAVLAWRTESVESFVDEICSSLTTDYRGESWITDASISKIRSSLASVFSSIPLYTAYKAEYLAQQFDRSYVKSKVFSDIRPVFGRSVDEGSEPLTAIVVHTLNIAYRDAQGISEFYFGMTNGDLRDIKNSVERALAKATVLERLIPKMGVRMLPKEDAN